MIKAVLKDMYKGVFLSLLSAIIISSGIKSSTENGKNACEVAKSFTVMIDTSSDIGSGIIYERIGEQYYVITNAHVVPSNGVGKSVKITTAIDGKVHNGIVRNIYAGQKNPDIAVPDIAVIVFKSQNLQYSKAEIRKDEVRKDELVYLAGFPVESKKYNCISGKVLLPQLPKAPEAIDGLYSIGISPTIAKDSLAIGMSGGALLDSKGSLLGVNGLKGYPAFGSFQYYDGTPIILDNMSALEANKYLRPLSWAIPFNIVRQSLGKNQDSIANVSKNNLVPPIESITCKKALSYTLPNEIFSADLSQSRIQIFSNGKQTIDQELKLDQSLEPKEVNCIEKITSPRLTINIEPSFVIDATYRNNYTSYAYSIIYIFNPKTSKYQQVMMKWLHPNGYQLIDVDRDGIMEFSMSDGSFSRNLCSLQITWETPLPKRLFKFKDTRLVDVTTDLNFKSFINQQIEDLRKIYQFQIDKKYPINTICGTITAYTGVMYLSSQNKSANEIINKSILNLNYKAELKTFLKSYTNKKSGVN